MFLLTSVVIMKFAAVVFFSKLLWVSSALEYKFPTGFKFGVATAAYQVEGAWNTSDKSECIWDHLLHTKPEVTVDGSNGDVACDSYHLWRRDIEMIEELGVDMYRFSISWSRLLPSGFPNHISEDGKRYYNNLIDGLLEKGIEPIVTIYHFDLPQSLQDLGGWTNPLIVDWFADYARVVFSLFADRVKIWLTINETFAMCDYTYRLGLAPYIFDNKIAQYLCNKYALIAHAKVYRIYDEIYRPKYNGKVSLTSLFFWFKPATPDDIELTKLAIDYWGGRYDHPVFSKEGGWPKKLKQLLIKNGIKEGYPYPRLPPFTAEEIEFVKGTYDFYALNHYTTRLVGPAKPGEILNSDTLFALDELGINFTSDPSWENTAADWFSITLAINDGVPVTGYMAWTLMDNFEWLGGYRFKFGLYAVDHNHPNRTRTQRESAKFYARVVKNRSLRILGNDLI